MNKYIILVTGCGGDIGQSIGKILCSSGMFQSVIGCDMNDEHPGKFIFNEFIKIPHCKSTEYFHELKKVIIDFSVDFILPVSEPELRHFANSNIHSSLFGKTLIKANFKSMQVGFDKYLTAMFLKNEGMPFPKTKIVSEIEHPELPLILKSRNGSGSTNIFFIENTEDFSFYKKKYPEYIAQQFLENANEEYTCGLFRSKRGEIRDIIFKRKLTGGFSGFGYVVENVQIHELLISVAKKLELVGSINIQLRLTDKGPMIFEINPRFSSTAMFRHLMGFKDVIWSIEDSLNLSVSDYNPPSIGKKFYKGYHEYID